MNNRSLVREPNKGICFGYGCNNKATEKISVDAGIFGNIILDLCSICVKKFR
ncbi:MAG: hypothetical protein L0H53_06435 [Candidatus Nitrosocosmicus sp.]|nr:hypothetical protein [Candidatus Nitrosocosmicus sp.]MDN5867133.1 hypothetical protein [Candidatus Nitrosocosmicus sp.]